MSLDDLYRQVIMDHYQHPRNRGRLEGANVRVNRHNPTCGDVVEVQLKTAGDLVQDARFVGEGCSISLAAASMATEAIKGKRLAEVRELVREYRRMMRGEPADEERLGELAVLQGVSKFPMRIKCATLVFTALEDAIGSEPDGGGN